MKDGASIRPWIKSIINHMYWVAGSSSSDADLKEQKWLSILNHVADIHDGHGDKFEKCIHEELDRDWLVQGMYLNIWVYDHILGQNFVRR